MINAVLRKDSISHRKLPIREILTGKKLIIPLGAVGWYIHAIPGGASNPGYNSTDKKRSFKALYQCTYNPTKEGDIMYLV